MATNTSSLKENNLGDVQGDALGQLEQLWEEQGKTPERKRWLRYYYRNRERFLAKRTEAKKSNTPRRLGVRIVTQEYVEKVDIKPGLLS